MNKPFALLTALLCSAAAAARTGERPPNFLISYEGDKVLDSVHFQFRANT